MSYQYSNAILYAPDDLSNTYADEILSWDEIGCPPLLARVPMSV